MEIVPKTSEMGRVPPQNIEAEMSLLGAILLDKEAMFKIVDLMEAEYFYKNSHKRIYETMLELYAKSEPIDVLTLSNRLREKKLIEQVGGNSYIVKLSNMVPTASHIEQYANIVRKKATHRQLLSAAEHITKLGYQEENEDIGSLLDDAQKHIYAITNNHIRANFTPIKHVLDGAFERIDTLHQDKGKLRGVPSGFKD
ncbi:MAG: replicative DNA helicase, partial [Candidatus Magasanikbacteria bacterium]|nr:replicative DNA helicase [Candidatus Magasanikbacteria bacterium]